MSPLDRRRFLTRSLGTLGAGGVGLAIGAGLGEQAAAGAPAGVSPVAEAEQVNKQALAVRLPFDGPYQ
jgi:hypothetical protein